MAIHANGRVFAVAGVAMKASPMLESFEKTLTVAILDECGLVLENEYNRIEKRRIEEKARAEELRSNLLRAISHDLRCLWKTNFPRISADRCMYRYTMTRTGS